MSTTIDERVVEMRFDNKHFESNVSTTMSTLDKLKQKLNLSGASKGLESINESARRVNLEPVSRSAETVGLKFNAMYTIADQALRNITNSAMMYGKRIISALTIDPVKTGFQEYELKMNSVQTIMASTGEDIATVNKYLQELNEYSDQTIYSFSDMTSNIGKFTNAGVKLEDAVAAIKGISNEAALSGANANEASRAMYNFSQALSAGYVKLIDWKSIENANMATKGFKEELIKTAVELKTVTDLGDGMYETLSGKTFNATKNFNDVLQEQWMTSDVLITTLKKYADTNEDIGIKATEAATKVKTFTQLWDTLKESAQSGWATSWEILVGDLEEAKDLLTGISKFVGGIIDATSDWRNILLDGVFGDTFGRIKDILDKSGLGTLDRYTDNVSNLTEMLEYYQKVVDKVWRGDYNNRGDDPDRFDLLTGEGYDPRIVQNLVNLGKDHTLTVEELEAAYAKWGKTAEGTAEATESIVTKLEDLSDEQLHSIGLTDVEIKLLRHLERIAKATGKSLSEVLEERANLSGRQMVIDSFKGIAKVLGQVADAVKVAWEAVFNPAGLSSEEKMSNRIMTLYTALTKFYDVASNLTLTKDSAEKLTRTFRGLFAILDIVATLLGGGFRIAFKIVNEVLKYFSLSILDVTALVGDALVSFQQWFNSLFDVSGVLDVVVPAIKAAAQWIKELCAEIAATDEFKEFREHLTEAGTAFRKLADGFTESGVLKKFASALGSVIEVIGQCIRALADSTAVQTFIKFIGSGLKSISDWIEGLKSIDGSELAKHIVKGIVVGVLSIANAIWNLVFGLGGDIVRGLAVGISSTASVVFNAILKIGSYIVEAIKDYFGIHSPSTLMITIGGFIIAGLVSGLDGGLPGVWNVVKSLCSGVVNTITGLVESIRQLDAGTLIAGAITGGIVIAVWKVADAVRTLASPLEGLGDMFEAVGTMCKRFGKSIRNYFNAKAVQTLVVSMAILVGAIVVMGYAMSDPKVAQGIKDSFWILAGLAGVIALMAAAVVGLNALGAKAEGGEATLKNIMLPLLTIAATMLILAGVLKMISGVGDTAGALKTMLAIAIGVLAFATVMGLIGRNGMFDGVEKAGLMLLTMSASMLLMIGVVKLAGQLSKGEVTRGLAVVTAIGLLFAVIVRVCKTGNSYYAEPSGLLKMSIAMGIMVAVVKLAGNLDKSEVQRGMGFVAAVGLLFLAFVAVSKIAGEHASSAGGMLLKMALAMLTMVWVVKLAAGISPDDIKHALPTIAVIGGIFAALVGVSYFAGKNADKAGAMLIKMSAALLVLSGVIFILGLMKPEILAKGLIAISLLSLCFMGLVKATTGLKATKSMVSVLVMLAVVIGLLGGIVIGMSFIDPGRLRAATTAMVGLVGIFTVLTLAMRLLERTEIPYTKLLALLAAVAVLGGIIWGMSSKVSNPDGAVKNAEALSILLLTISASMAILNKTKFDTAGGIGKSLLAMAGLVGVVAILAQVLGKMGKHGVEASVTNAIALGVLINALAAASIILGYVKPIDGAVIGTLTILSLLVGVLGVILVSMNNIDPAKALTNALALAGLMAALAGIAALLGLVGNLGKGILMGAGAMAILAVVMGVVAAILWSMDSMDAEASLANARALGELMIVLTLVASVLALVGHAIVGIALGMVGLTLLAFVMLGVAKVLEYMDGLDPETNISNAKALANLMLALTLVASVLSVIGFLSVGIVAGAVGMAALVGVMALIVLVLKLMENMQLENGKANADLLMTVLNCMGDLLVKMAIYGPLALVGVAAMAGILALVAATTAVLVALGGLSKIPGFSELIADGGVVLGLIGTAIGSFIGGIIEAVESATATSLPSIGMALSDFMDNASYFIERVSSIDDSIINGTECLTKAIFKLCMADFISGIGQLIGIDIAELGTNLSDFANEAGDFFTTVSSIDESVMSGVRNLAEAILMISAADVLDALTFWDGKSSLASFAEQLPLLGGGLGKFKTELEKANFTADDANLFEEVALAIGKMTEAAKNIPNTGGLLGAIVGNNDLGAFAEQFGSVASGLATIKAQFSNGSGDDASLASVGPWTNEDTLMVENIGKAIGALASAAKEIPNTGGVLGALVGNNDLGPFVEQFGAVGENVIALKDKFKDKAWTKADTGMVENIAGAVSALAKSAQDIPNSGGVLAGLLGDNELGGFVAKLPTVADNMILFRDRLVGARWTQGANDLIELFRASVESLSSMARVVNDNVGLWDAVRDAVGGGFMGFIEKLPDVAKHMRTFKNELGSHFTKDTAAVVASLADTIRTFSTIKPEETSADALVVYTSTLPGVASNMSLFATNMSDMTAEVLSACRAAVSSIMTSVAHILTYDATTAYGKSVSLKLCSENLSSAVWRLADLYDTVDFAESVIKTLKDMLSGLVGLDTSGITLLGDAMKQLADNGITRFSETFSGKGTEEKLKGSVKTMVDNAATAVDNNSDTLETAFEDLATTGRNAVGTEAQYKGFYSAGSYLVTGFANGVIDNTWRASAAAKTMANAAKKAAMVSLDAHSPSREFYKIGGFAGLGFANAFEDYTDKSYDAAFGMADSAKSGLSDAISRIRKMIDAGMDTQPTIRPIMDLSDIKSGVGAMNNLLGMGSSHAVLANVGAINTTMNRRNQNGGIDDIVSSIDKLRKDLGNVGSTNYNINGLSYSGDAELDAAFKTIVRAVKVGRRV